MRIVSLTSSGTEMLFALELGEQVVAVSHECDFPETARALPRATRSWIDSSRTSDEIDRQVKERLSSDQSLYDIDADLICRLAPELIVTQAQCDVCAVRYESVLDLVRSRPELAKTSVLALNPQSLSEMLSDVGTIARAANVQVTGDRLGARLQARIESVSMKTAKLDVNNQPRVVCIEWVQPLMVAGNWTPELIALAGGTSGSAKAGEHSDYISWGGIRNFDPEVLLVAPCGFDLARSMDEARQLLSLPGFADLAAVRNARAFVIDGNAYLNRSGPRLVESLEIVAHLIHPELFLPPPLSDAWLPLL